MTQKSRFVVILFDRNTSAQITATFNDINSIDQVVPGMVKQLKVYNEKKGSTSKILTGDSVEDYIRKIKWSN